ncbi:MAG: hypothetical protein IKE55_07340 [Kiritimatiellae bacterium]|nr:hypothetical protein [Kiritimatiellia bacterium]
MNPLVPVLLAASAVASLQKALDSSAAWTMERRLPGSGRTLVSSGEVRCSAGKGITWQTLRPFVSSVAMTHDAMVFTDEDGRRVKPLSELPHYADIRRATDAFAAGRTNAFDGVFSVREEALPGGGWRLSLTPEVPAMRRLFATVEVTGAELPTNAVLTAADGGTTTIRFMELQGVR